jgi:hypothetical protein
MATINPVEPPRTKEGIGWAVAAFAAFLLGLFGAFAAAGGGAGALGFSMLCFAIMSGCLAVAFWTRLAHLIELRLIDIQRELRRLTTEEPPPP